MLRNRGRGQIAAQTEESYSEGSSSKTEGIGLRHGIVGAIKRSVGSSESMALSAV
jgi:hypothetical protein